MPAPATHFTIKLPVKPYVKKFIITTYGNGIKLDWYNPIGGIVLSLLQTNSFFVNMNKAKKDKRILNLKESILFYAPISTMRYKGDSLSPDRIIAANRVLESLFIEKLSLFCEKKIRNHSRRPGIDNAILAFCEEHSIEIDVDITFEALKKAEYRHRKNTQKNLQTFVLSPEMLISTAL